MTIREVITADEGKVLTNGEIYGRTIFLGSDDRVSNYREITQAEYEEILSETIEGADGNGKH